MKQWSEMTYKKTNMLAIWQFYKLFTSYKKLLFVCFCFFA